VTKDRMRPTGSDDAGRRWRWGLALLAITLVTAVVGETPAWGAGPPLPTTVFKVDADAVLKAHNDARSEVGVPPLTWDPALAADAQVWTDHLASTGQFYHGKAAEKGSARARNQGENLLLTYPSNLEHSTPARDTMGIDGTEGWYAEKANWNRGRAVGGPSSFTTGHYTQMIWTTTERVGCAASQADGRKILFACRYAPPGNYIGETPFTKTRPPAKAASIQSAPAGGSVGVTLPDGKVSATAQATPTAGGSGASSTTTSTAKPTSTTTTAAPTTTTTSTTTTTTTTTTTPPTTTTPATVPTDPGACGASVAGPTPEANVTKLRCLIDAARAQADLPPTVTNSNADYFASLVAGGSTRINPATVCSGKPPASTAQGQLPEATAQKAFDAMGGIKSQLVSSKTASLLGIAFSRGAFGLFQATCR